MEGAVSEIQDMVPVAESAEANQGGLAPWLVSARKKATERLSQSGLPRRRDEYWKYTNPDRLELGKASSATRHVADPAAALEELVPGGAQIVIAGESIECFDGGNADQLEVTEFKRASCDGNHWGSRLYGELESAAQSLVPRGFAALNTRDADRGVFVRCNSGGSRALQFYHKPCGAAGSGLLHNVISVEPGAELSVVEFGASDTASNQVLEVEVQQGARYNHIRVQDCSASPPSLVQVFARVEEEGSFNLFTLSANHDVIRNECVVHMAGDHARAHMAGAVIGAAGSHHDDTVLVIHDAPNCQSRQVFKKVLADNAVGVFQGKILVRQGAQKTDGYQISKGLLVGEQSQFLTKPELEIYADDVVCSHGSTSGSTDADSLFYLRARGIPRTEAMNLLALAFLAETLDEVSDASQAESLRQLMIHHLAGRSHAEHR